MNKLKGRKTVFSNAYPVFRFIRWIIDLDHIEDVTTWKEESVSRRGENNSRPVGAFG